MNAGSIHSFQNGFYFEICWTQAKCSISSEISISGGRAWGCPQYKKFVDQNRFRHAVGSDCKSIIKAARRAVPHYGMEMSMPEMKDTEVTKWLEQNYADPSIVKLFYEQEFYNLSDVHESDVDALIKDKRGLVNRLKASLKQAAEKSAPKPEAPTRQPLPPPDLPAGEVFDLSAPTLQHNDVKFVVPSELQVNASDGPPRAPADLKNAEWMVIAKYAKLIYGFDISQPEPSRPRDPVYCWKVPAESFVQNEEDRSHVSSAVTYSSEVTSYVRAGFDKEAATASYAFCSASFARSHKERHAQAQSHTSCDMTGFWNYPRARVFLDRCMVVSPQFIEAVKQAVAASDPKKAILDVLSGFGHVVPTEVLIGGRLIMRHSEDDASYANDTEYQHQIEAAVNIKVGAGAGSASTAIGTASHEQSAGERIAQSTSFEAIGGNTLLASSPAQWTPTLAAADRWAVIENLKIVSTLDLLDAELREKALAFWPKDRQPIPDAMDVKPNTVQHAPADGFLTARIEARAENDGGEVYIFSDGSSDPTTQRASAGVRWWRDQEIKDNSAFVPIRKGDYYKIFHGERWGSPGVTGRFQPFPVGFGAWEALELNKIYEKRDVDGFVVLGMVHDKDGDRTVALGRQGPDMKAYVATSYHWYDHSDVRIHAGSFCMPVPKGNDFKIDYVQTGGGFKQAFWIPMGRLYRQMGLEPRGTNESYLAETDGMLFGYVAANNATGSLSVQMAQSEELSNPEILSSGTALYKTDSDKLVPYAAVAAIIPAGQTYRAVCSEGVSTQLSWVPIVVA
jgi:hypothetical protein